MFSCWKIASLLLQKNPFFEFLRILEFLLSLIGLYRWVIMRNDSVWHFGMILVYHNSAYLCHPHKYGKTSFFRGYDFRALYTDKSEDIRQDLMMVFLLKSIEKKVHFSLLMPSRCKIYPFIIYTVQHVFFFCAHI